MRHPLPSRWRGPATALLLAAILAGCSGGSHTASSGPTATSTGAPPSTSTPPPATTTPGLTAHLDDWPEFGVVPARTNVYLAPTGLQASAVPHLHARTVALPGTVDSSPIYLQGVDINGRKRDGFFMTTTYGRTLAVSPRGVILWTYTPPGYSSYAGTAQITTATPVADPSRAYIYAASPDGLIHKLYVANGHEQTAGRWPMRVSLLPAREKIASALTIASDRLYVVTGGYIGDQPPYQGHVVVIDIADGRVTSVFNTLCADARGLQHPPSCAHSDSAIWGRAGAVVDPASGDILVATGNAFVDGKDNWGDSVLELGPQPRRPLHTYTPANQAQLNAEDKDLGSTAPALLSSQGPLIAQSGKDGVIQLVDMGTQGVGGLGGELQTLPAPGGAEMFSAIAVWRRSPADVVLFVANGAGTEALRLHGSGRAARLAQLWSNSTAGTSPVMAGGLLYVYDPGGTLNVYRPASGERVASLQAAPGHWNSPIVAGGVIALPVGDANSHQTTGELLLYQ